MNTDESRLREAVVEAGKALVTHGLTRGSFGNISARIPGTSVFLITPSGMDYFSLKPDDIVLVDGETYQVTGCRRPSIEIHLHGEIYRARGDVDAVVHTHSPYASAMAAARKPIPPVLDEVGMLIGGEVQVAEHETPGTIELARNCVRALGSLQGVLIANHGSIGVGADLKSAFAVAESMEGAAMALLLASLVGGAVPLTAEEVRREQERIAGNYGQRP
jgi:L-fuculose-phosphate aldolase